MLGFDILRELIGRNFECPYRVCTSSEETFTGLLLLALVAGGKAENVAAAAELVRAAQPIDAS